MVLSFFFIYPAFGERIFQIGELDGSYREFAIAGDYASYPKLFPHDVVFKIGESKEKSDFPYIHPGPSDFWAGSRAHSVRLIFQLDHMPRPSVRLLLYFVNTHYSAPPFIVIYLNGKAVASRQLPPGGSDASLTDPSKGQKWVEAIFLHSEDFRLGENEIIIENRRGSWLLYDAILLEEGLNLGKPKISSLKAKSVPFFLKTDSDIKQVIQVWLTNSGGEGEVDLSLQGKESKKDMRVKVVSGENFLEIPLDEGLLSGGEIKLKAEDVEISVPVKRAKKWFLFLAPSVHTDIGYTDVQTNVYKRHNENLLIAIDECKKNPNFKWNLEVAWQVENFLKGEPDKIGELFQLLRDGHLSLQGLYANMLTGLCSPEALARLCLFAGQVAKMGKFPLDSALLSDVPSAIWSTPSILSASGIKYFAEAINTYRARFPYPPHPFYWEGPDGGKVLFFPSPGYGWARGIGLLESMESLSSKIASLIEGLEGGGYPYDAYLLYGGFYDNELLDPQFMKLVEEWNKKYAYPRIIVATNSEFFRYLEEKYGDKIPTYKFDAGAYWEDGAVSTAKELAMNREAKNWATEAEILFSISSLLAPSFKYPTEELKELWRNILMFDEHTWGAWCSVSDPYAETTIKQWEIKSAFANNAYEQGKKLREEAISHFATLVSSDGESLLVFNPLSFPRSDIVRAKIPLDEFALFDGSEEIAWQRDGEDVIFFLKDVPTLGYKVLRIERRKPSPSSSAFSVSNGKIENKFFQVEADEKGIFSLIDKISGRQLVDEGKRLGDYLYLAGPGGKQEVHNLEKGRVWVENVGPVFADLCYSSSAYKTPSFTLRLRLYRDLPRCDLQVELEKEETLDKESVFISFPFAFYKPRVRLEYPGCVVEPEKDQFRQACKNWFTIHQWVALDDGNKSIVWCSLDAPLLSLEKPIHQGWVDELKIEKGYIFSYLMHNHWDTNYKASQGGRFRFRYSIISLPNVLSNEEATRIGWEYAHPLICKFIPSQEGILPPQPHSFLEVKGAELTTLKKREQGSGWILRVWRAERRGGRVEVRLNLPVRKAYKANLREEREEMLDLKDSVIGLELPPSALQSILLMEK
ncbi:hypothetical protein H5T87_00405 [bacterium]|nr:hypothetical protein [bacterium]